MKPIPLEIWGWPAFGAVAGLLIGGAILYGLYWLLPPKGEPRGL